MLNTGEHESSTELSLNSSIYGRSKTLMADDNVVTTATRKGRRQRIKIQGALPPDDRGRVGDGVTIEFVSLSCLFELRTKGAEEATVCANKNNIYKARERCCWK